MSDTHFVNIRINGSETLAATYDAGAKTLIPVDSRVTIETGADFWALLFNDEYVMILDTDGLSVGDLKPVNADALVFYECGCGWNNMVAELTEQGILAVRDVFEVNEVTGFNLQDIVAFDSQGMKVLIGNEIYLLANDEGAYVTNEAGLLIQVRL